MDAAALLEGDYFVEVDEATYAEMTPKERGKLRVRAALSGPQPCHTQPNSMHLRSSAGTWCLPRTSPVCLVD